ncbi:MAG: hypothetical protein M1829_004516 [Trizodia sp. TS-e1964]|nr:MAG: hypothetical protein M1829_004516 [Trizodia sp. TS-e1964]
MNAAIPLADEVEDLTDEQIASLLKDAELRLRAAEAVPNTSIPKLSSFKVPKLHIQNVPRPYIPSAKNIARTDPSLLVSQEQRHLSSNPRRVEDPTQLKQAIQMIKKATAGPDWFNLPKTVLTSELKRDLQLLRMRSVLDPKRHYKKDQGPLKFKPPQFSQVGTVIEGPTEFFSARLQNKQRKKNFVEEVLYGGTSRFKSKYSEIQEAKTSGRRGHYKKLMAKRLGKGKKALKIF